MLAHWLAKPLADSMMTTKASFGPPAGPIRQRMVEKKQRLLRALKQGFSDPDFRRQLHQLAAGVMRNK